MPGEGQEGPPISAREGFLSKLKSFFGGRGNAGSQAQVSEQAENSGEVRSPIKIVEPPNPLSPFSKAEPKPIPDRTPSGESGNP